MPHNISSIFNKQITKIIQSFSHFINLTDTIYSFIYFMLAKLLIFLAFLTIGSKCLVNKTDSTEAFPLFSSVLFQKDQIFYVSKIKNSFGYISKSSGVQTLKFQLQFLQKLISSSSTEVYVSIGERVHQYSIQSRKSSKVALLYPQNISEYQGYQRFKHGFYILADDTLTLNEWKTHQQALKQIPLNLASGETVKQMQVFGENVILLTKNSNQYCLILVQKTSVINKKCSALTGNGQPKLEVSGKSIFIIYTNKAELLNQSFELVETFNESLLQADKGLASFSNFRSYDISGRKFQNYKIVSHDTRSGTNKLVLTEGEYILKQNQSTIANIPNISSQPVGAWLSKKEAALGRIQGKYELLLQFSSGVANFYQIKVNFGGSVQVVLKWSK